MAIKDDVKKVLQASGAVRHTQEGKGRFDLLPPAAIKRLAQHFENGAAIYGDRNWEKGLSSSRCLDSALRHTFQYLDGERDEDHLAAAIWNLCVIADNEVNRPSMCDIPSRSIGIVQPDETPVDPEQQRCIKAAFERLWEE